MSRIPSVVLAVLLTTATLSVAAVGGVAGAAAPSQNASQTQSHSADAAAYQGTHVAFNTSSDAVTDYRVGGATLFDDVSVASQSDHDSRAGLGADAALSSVVNLSGLGLELGVETETRADLSLEGSSSGGISAHDSERGILTVAAGDDDRYVEADLASGVTAESDGDGRVAIDGGERDGAFVVVGDGEVAVNEDGNVVADLEGDSTLVFRSYGDGERDDEARAQEDLIADGEATAEVYAEVREDGERVADVATYGQDIAVEASADAEDRLEVTAERAADEGTIVIVGASDAVLETVGSAEDLAVTVDGDVATEASSYSELEGAIGEEPRYMVVQESDAAASADVLVAVDHFSEREIAVQNADDVEDADDGMSGFGPVVALAALALSAAARVRS
ncbi:hypothetical protein ACFQGT_19365 [Natrialbaceae archaeon GCM10025810]|uniref:hypothetical protein n=1 Tax=Halovalidus salilacus TaxID=3075124 RepID=UPI00360B681D